MTDEQVDEKAGKQVGHFPAGPERVFWFRAGTIMDSLNVGMHKFQLEPKFVALEDGWYFVGLTNDNNSPLSVKPVVKHMVAANEVVIWVRPGQPVPEGHEPWPLEFDSLQKAQAYMDKAVKGNEAVTFGSFRVVVGSEATFQKVGLVPAKAPEAPTEDPTGDPTGDPPEQTS